MLLQLVPGTKSAGPLTFLHPYSRFIASFHPRLANKCDLQSSDLTQYSGFELGTSCIEFKRSPNCYIIPTNYFLNFLCCALFSDDLSMSGKMIWVLEVTRLSIRFCKEVNIKAIGK